MKKFFGIIYLCVLAVVTFSAVQYFATPDTKALECDNCFPALPRNSPRIEKVGDLLRVSKATVYCPGEGAECKFSGKWFIEKWDFITGQMTTVVNECEDATSACGQCNSIDHSSDFKGYDLAAPPISATPGDIIHAEFLLFDSPCDSGGSYNYDEIDFTYYYPINP